MAKPQYGWAHQQARALAIKAMVEGTPCWRCNRPMYKRQRLELDHVIPVANGGANGPTRLVHRYCNSAAGARLGNRLKAIRGKGNGRHNGWLYRRNGGSNGGGNGRRLPRW